MEKVEVAKTRVLSSKNYYPKGANSPTVITKYKCLCGWGKIIEENVIGFDDHFINIKCRRCLKKYHPFVDILGNEWVVYEKEQKK